MSVSSEVPATFRSSAIQPGAVAPVRNGLAEILSRRRVISYLVRTDIKKKGSDRLLGNAATQAAGVILVGRAAATPTASPPEIVRS